MYVKLHGIYIYISHIEQQSKFYKLDK